MNDVKGETLADTLAFRLGTLGAVVTARYTAKIEQYGVKPKHVGLMLVLESGAAASQQELAKLMGVAPSQVVALADQLEDLRAVQRVRDQQDRRRQALTLTDRGRALLANCTEAARALDAELAVTLGRRDLDLVRKGLGKLAVEIGLPVTP